MAEWRAVTYPMALKYRQASRLENTAVMDQVAELTGWHRDHGRAELRPAGTLRVAVPRKTRPPTYSPRIISGIEQCWRVARCRVDKHLAPMLATLVSMLRRDGELDLGDVGPELLIARCLQQRSIGLCVTLRPGRCFSLRFRVRTGDYRIIYEIHDQELLVLVLGALGGYSIYRNQP